MQKLDHHNYCSSTEFASRAGLGAVAVIGAHFDLSARRIVNGAPFKGYGSISKNPEMSTRQVTAEVGISNGSAYYVITALVKKGRVKLGNLKKSPRRGHYAYLLMLKGIRENSLLTHSFIVRKHEELKMPKAEIKALEEEAGLAAEATPGPRGFKQ
jgi:hypothetical protein